MRHSRIKRERQAKRRVALLAAILTILLVLPENAHAFESVKFAIREICGHMEGHLGGLLMTVSAVGGIAAAALGNVRAMQSMIITGIGAATVSAFLSLYFETAAAECRAGGVGVINTGTPGETRTINDAFKLPESGITDALGETDRGGLNTASVNTALSREVDFSGAAVAGEGADSPEDGAFDQEFSNDESDAQEF